MVLFCMRWKVQGCLSSRKMEEFSWLNPQDSCETIELIYRLNFLSFCDYLLKDWGEKWQAPRKSQTSYDSIAIRHVTLDKKQKFLRFLIRCHWRILSTYHKLWMKSVCFPRVLMCQHQSTESGGTNLYKPILSQAFENLGLIQKKKLFPRSFDIWERLRAYEGILFQPSKV